MDIDKEDKDSEFIEEKEVIEVYKNVIKEPNLQIKLIINIDLDNEKINKIDKVYELSDGRIAIIEKKGKNMKIYSLKNGKMITKINQDNILGIIELKNKDVVLNSKHEIFFYKLLPNKNYELYQEINEFNQGNNIFKKCIFNELEKTEYYKLNSIYQLMNNNLVSCNSYGIKIYKKDKDGQYKLSFMKELGEEVKNVVEIKNNILIIFHIFVNLVSSTFEYYVFTIYKFDIGKQELTMLNQSRMTDRQFNIGACLITYQLINNYLFVRYGLSLGVYDISKDMEFVKYNFNGTGRNVSRFGFPVEKFICNYEGDIFVARDTDYEYRLFRFENNSFKAYNLFPYIKRANGLIKLKNNNFIFFNKNSITLLNKIN